MSAEPEEEFFDQELRNAFHSFALPPAEHPDVWTGIEGRIAGLPVVARPGWPRLLAWPVATAVVGVAVGWLLPHPAVLPVPAPAPTEVRLQPVVLQNTATPMPGAGATVAAPNYRPATAPAVPLLASAPHRVAAKPAVAQPAAETTAEQPAGGTLNSWPVAQPDLAATVPGAEQLVATADNGAAAQSTSLLAQDQSATQPTAPTALLSRKQKPEGTNERIVYHKPRSRQPESGTGIRRWFSHLSQSLRHFIGL